jgi:FkbM family methyltransferase
LELDVQAAKPSAIPVRIKLVRQLIRHWPMIRGRALIVRLLLPNGIRWPKTASFNFRYGVFVNTPISPWPLGYRDLYLFDEMESHEVDIWRRVLRAGDNVVDGGANYGYWSLVAACLVGKSGTVHAFEPVPSTYASLQSNIRASRAANVRPYLQALSDHAGTCAINLSENDPLGCQASLRSRTDCESAGTAEVQLAPLADVLHEDPIRLIKLDVEGGEMAALVGAMSILRRDTKPVVTFEWNRTTSAAFGYTPEAIGALLGTLGYGLFLTSPRGLVPFEDRAADGLGWGWIPMVWALTAQHKKELGM